jgi:hypothetical protein
MTINSVEVIGGSAGNIGPPGPAGPSYVANSTSSMSMSVGPKTFITQPDLAYQVGTRARAVSVADPTNNWMEGIITSATPGTMIINMDLLSASRDAYAHADWNISVAGERGQNGSNGAQGQNGTPGNVIWHGPSAPTPTNPPSPVNGDWYLQITNPAVPGSPAYLFGPYNSVTGWPTPGLLLAVGPAGPTGAQGPQGPPGATGPQGNPGPTGPGGAQGVPGNTGPAGAAGPGYGGTSTTSLTIGIGSITFAIQAGLAYQVGARVRLSSHATPVNWMEGQVTAYSGTSMTVNVLLVQNSGTFANWDLNIAGTQGAQGPQGPAGAGSGDMLRSNNLSDVLDVPTAQNNLGMATVAKTGNYNDLSNKPVVIPPQRLAIASPIVVGTNDEIINCNITSGAPTCALPNAGARGGRRIVFKDSGGQFGAHPLTLTPTGADTIDGLASVTLSTNRQYISLRPYNDGTSIGWFIEG